MLTLCSGRTRAGWNPRGGVRVSVFRGATHLAARDCLFRGQLLRVLADFGTRDADLFELLIAHVC